MINWAVLTSISILKKSFNYFQLFPWSFPDFLLAGQKRNWLGEIPILYFIIFSSRHHQGTPRHTWLQSIPLSLLLAQELPFNLIFTQLIKLHAMTHSI